MSIMGGKKPQYINISTAANAENIFYALDTLPKQAGD